MTCYHLPSIPLIKWWVNRVDNTQVHMVSYTAHHKTSCELPRHTLVDVLLTADTPLLLVNGLRTRSPYSSSSCTLVKYLQVPSTHPTTANSTKKYFNVSTMSCCQNLTYHVVMTIKNQDIDLAVRYKVQQQRRFISNKKTICARNCQWNLTFSQVTHDNAVV